MSATTGQKVVALQVGN